KHNVKRGISLFEEALSLISEKGYWHLRTRLQLWLAETFLRIGRLSEAEPHLDVALATTQKQGRVLLLMRGERLYARLLAARGDWSSAHALFIKINYNKCLFWHITSNNCFQIIPVLCRVIRCHGIIVTVPEDNSRM